VGCVFLVPEAGCPKYNLTKAEEGEGDRCQKAGLLTNLSDRNTCCRTRSSTLIVLPWVVFSWYQRQDVQSPKLSGEGIPGTTAIGILAVVPGIPSPDSFGLWTSCLWYQENTTHGSTIGQVGQKTCLLTAITLTLFGFGQIIRTNHQKAGSFPGIPSPDSFGLWTSCLWYQENTTHGSTMSVLVKISWLKLFLSDKLVKRPAF
jgi:hypothetical protein